MIKSIAVFLLCLIAKFSNAQDARQKVERACLDYLEGFYEGDTAKLVRSLQPSLYKYGFWKDDKSGKYNPDGHMTYREAVDYAKKVFALKKTGNADVIKKTEVRNIIKKVEILDIMNCIASAKITAWWGIDYILLSKQDDKWMIEEVLWEGPLQK